MFSSCPQGLNRIIPSPNPVVKEPSDSQLCKGPSFQYLVTETMMRQKSNDKRKRHPFETIHSYLIISHSTGSFFFLKLLFPFVVIVLCSVGSDSWDPTDRSLPGSSVSGISQAKILKRIAIFPSRGSSRLNIIFQKSQV